MLSLHNVTASQAAHYFNLDNYYSRAEGMENSEWCGKGALRLGLQGKIKAEEFAQLLIGRSPDGARSLRGKGDQEGGRLPAEKVNALALQMNELLARDPRISELVRLAVVADFKKATLNKDFQDRVKGQALKSTLEAVAGKSPELDSLVRAAGVKPKQRAGIDCTFSAPKSVSLAAFLGQDERLVEAHHRAVRHAIEILEERYSNTRTGGKGNRGVETTGNLTVAMFQHDTSRAKDPQLHTHCVVLNITERADGKWRSHHADETWKNSKFLGTIYQNELAREVRSLGYEIEMQREGTFEIKGYTREQIEVFSKRREQVLENGGHTQKLAREAVLKGRAAKGREVPRSELLGQWENEAKAAGVKHPIADQEKAQEAALFKIDLGERVTRAAQVATERTVAARREVIETAAMAERLGDVSFRAVESKLAQNMPSVKKTQDERFVTSQSLAREAEYLRVMERGRGRFLGVMSEGDARLVADRVDAASKGNGHKGLTQGQRNAVEMTLTSPDRVVGWQGVAGAGKTYSMNAIREALESRGMTVVAVAPTATAAENLGKEAKIEKTQTVARLLMGDVGIDRAEGKEFWIVDEAGLLSSKDLNRLLRRAELENTRVVLVGDKRQLPSVEAGSPFRHLQEHGMRMAYLDQSLRFRSPYMQQAANLMSQGKMLEGLQVLDKEKKIIEYTNKSTIVKKVRDEFLSLSKSERNSTIILTGTHEDRRDITQAIRDGLKGLGELRNEATLSILRKRDTLEGAKALASAYEIGDRVVPFRRGGGLERGMVYEVIGRNTLDNTVTLRSDAGTEKTLSARYLKAEIYQRDTIPLAEGDKVRWTKIHKDELGTERKNGEELTVSKIEGRHAFLSDEKGKKHVVTLSESQHLDHSWVKTTYSSQGLTCDRVLVAATSMVDRESTYVAVTRARHEAKIFTTDKEGFFKKAVGVSVEKETAEELVRPRTFQAFQERAEQELSQPTRETEERESEETRYWTEQEHELDQERETGAEIE